MTDLPLFYLPNVTEDQFALPEDESKHCIRVLRMQANDQLHTVDGIGNLSICTIIDPHPKRCVVRVDNITSDYGKRPFHLHIAIAPTKNIDRFEWFLEKATEIGVDTITPILCNHSERKAIKPDRLERVIVSAMKQSVKAYLPNLNPITTLEDLLRTASEELKLIAHCEQGQKAFINDYLPKSRSILVLIGPEGDFSPEEVKLAVGEGFLPVSLGNSRLRTETAGVVACTLANATCGLKI